MSYRPTVALLAFLPLFLSCKKNINPEELAQGTVVADQVFLIVERVISGQALSATIVEPYGLSESRDGYIYVVDRGTNIVIRFNSDLVPDKLIGGYGIGTETFNRPTFVAVDNGLNIYVSDENNRRVARYDARLNFVDEIAFKDEEDPFMFGYPSGIGVTSYGEVWIADRDKNQICLFNNVGNFSRFLGDFGSSEGQMKNPEKIVTEAGGKFYVCDAGHSRIVVYDEFGNFVRKLSFKEIEYPISAALEKDAVWVLDGSGSRIFYTDRLGNVLKSFGPIISGDPTPMNEPSDIIKLRDGRLLISDSGNHRLLICRIERGDNN